MSGLSANDENNARENKEPENSEMGSKPWLIDHPMFWIYFLVAVNVTVPWQILNHFLITFLFLFLLIERRRLSHVEPKVTKSWIAKVVLETAVLFVLIPYGVVFYAALLLIVLINAVLNKIGGWQ